MHSIPLERRRTLMVVTGFPLAREDERHACVSLRHRGATSTSCHNWPSWERLGGRVFVFGAVSPKVKRVGVLAKCLGRRVSVPTVAADGYPLARFYVARMPTRTCEVDVRNARTGRLLDSSGPVVGDSKADTKRCRSRSTRGR